MFVSARDLPPPYPATVKLIHPLPLLPSHPVCVNLSVKPDNSHSRWWGGRGSGGANDFRSAVGAWEHGTELRWSLE